MKILDIIIAVPVIWGIYKGLTKGLISEVAQFASLILGFILGSKLSWLLSDFLMRTFSLSERIIPVVSFGLIFLAVLLGVYFLARVFTKAAKSISLGWLNTIGGAIIGGLKFLLVIGIVLQMIMSNDIKSKVISEETREHSILLSPTLKITNFFTPYLKKALFDTDLYGEKSDQINEEEVTEE